MKILINGGGPSGLYFALLAAKRLGAEVTVQEQNPAGATYGFGIVLADRGLHRLRDADAESYALIRDSCYVSRHRVMSSQGKSVFIDGGGYGGAIARLRLLEILESCCRRAGVVIRHGARGDGAPAEAADLVVGADGVNSAVRPARDGAFGTTVHHLTNRLAWYGTQALFPYPILSFRKTELGHFWAVGYAYSDSMSTFVPECDERTWTRSLAHLSDADRTAIVEQVFAEELAGKPLISNKSRWGALPVTRVAQWHVGNHVLIGDALHSAHPSIGSGTRIAMEDAIALCECVEASRGDMSEGLRLFRARREPIKAKLVRAAEASIDWYEGIADRIDAMEPEQLVFDYLTRTGRIDEDRLRRDYPHFMDAYAAQWRQFHTAA